MLELQFEWDQKKELDIFQLHGVSFTDASKIFWDYHRIERYDDDSSDDEDRYQTIGYYHDVMFVVYTERADNIRLISVRIAETFERRIYANNETLPDGWERVNP